MILTAEIWEISLAIFSAIFSAAAVPESRSGPMKGANVRTAVRITFEEAVFGCEKEIEINYKEVCFKL